MAWLFLTKTVEQKPTVLVVDDDLVQLDVCVSYLRELGHEAEGVRSAASALEALERKRRTLVFTDLIMPQTNGKELLKAVKQRFPATDVIVMTGFPSIADAIISLKLGAYDFLIKPVSKDMLELTIKRCLEKRQLKTERDMEHMLRRRVEALQEKLEGQAAARAAWMDGPGRDLLRTVRETAAELERLSGAGLPPEARKGLGAAGVSLARVVEALEALLPLMIKAA